MRPLKEMLGSKVMFTLVVLKINNDITFKNSNKRQGSIAVKAMTGENLATCIETIKK